MRDLLLDVIGYFNKRRYVFLLLIIVVVLFLAFSRAQDKTQNTNKGDSDRNIAISESVSKGEKISQIYQNSDITTVDDVKDYIVSQDDSISAFFMLCKEGKYDIAYDLLSDDCKSILYPTVDDFKINYYSVIFKTNKECNVIGFKNSTYKVTYMEDALATGGASNRAIVDYITVTNDKKLNISNFIRRENLSSVANEAYYTIEATEKLIFVDYEIYKLKFSNHTKADIYITDFDNNKLGIIDEDDAVFAIEESEYARLDYCVPAGASKDFELRFSKKYNTGYDIKQIYFGSIKFENKKYYENVKSKLDDGTVVINSEERVTNYEESMKYYFNI